MNPNPIAVHFSAKSDLWETPQEFFEVLDAEFGFTLDVCALPENAKCARYYTPEIDGLSQDWGQHVCWCNPPYSQLRRWLEKAYLEAQRGATVVLLIPARTDTFAWHQYAMKADDIRFVRGRIRFSGARHCAPFPSAIVIFRRPEEDEQGVNGCSNGQNAGRKPHKLLS